MAAKKRPEMARYVYPPKFLEKKFGRVDSL